MSREGNRLETGANAANHVEEHPQQPAGKNEWFIVYGRDSNRTWIICAKRSRPRGNRGSVGGHPEWI